MTTLARRAFPSIALAVVAFGGLFPALAAGADAPAPPAAALAKVPTRPFVVSDAHLRELPRSANGRQYQLYVALPASYDTQPARRYPVIYICDGYWDFTLLRGFYGNLVYDKALPELIIVGIGYAGEKPNYDVLRRYDYTPVPDPSDRAGKLSGHAREFLDVVEKEIIPFTEREYRADPAYRVLGGSSLGGLFTLYAMLERPALFKAYVAPSPAVDWAQSWLFHREEELAKTRKELPVRLFMSGAGAEQASFLASIQRFSAQLQKRSYTGIHYQWRLVDGERHAGTKAESYNRGLRFAFAPLAPVPSEK
jgi:predicted alpha/beta superfamily hydrolase